MSQARYACWRGPDGKPLGRSEGKQGPTFLVKRLYESAVIKDDGSVQWRNLALFRDTPMLSASLMVRGPDGTEAHERDVEEIALAAVKEAVRTSKGKKVPSPEAFLVVMDRLAASFFRQPPRPYVLRTSLSAVKTPFRTVALGGCRIAALKSAVRYRRPTGMEQAIDDSALALHVKNTEYLPIVVRTSGRSVHAGFSTALTSLHLLRGLWTLQSSFRQWSRQFGFMQTKPRTVVHAGPVHTLHHPDGSPATDEFWYEPDFSRDQPLCRPDAGWAALTSFIRNARRLLRNSPFREDIQRLFVRYAQALDRPDEDTAFVNLWGVLESVTNTGRASYDTTIARATWIYANRQEAAEELGFLRMRRNRIVHASASTQDGGSSVHQLKAIVDPHLRHLLVNTFKVGSIQEYASLLDLPANTDSLRLRRRDLNKALRFHRRETKAK
jgi:hypothetical protein